MGVSRTGKLIFLFLLIGLRVLTNAIFFDRFGVYSSPGADIWFYIGVAQGHYHLFWGDPFQWFLPLLGSLGIDQLFWILLLISNALHVLTVVLLFKVLRVIYRDESAALWSTAAYACFSLSFYYTTGTLVHQQLGLPFMIGTAWMGYRYLQEKKPAFLYLKLLLLGIGLSIGPDIGVFGLAILPGFIAWKKFSGNKAVAFLWMAFYATGIFLLAILGWPAMQAVAAKVRGIDLEAQRMLIVGDLEPLSWARYMGSYSWLGFLWIGLFVLAVVYSRYFEMGLVLVPILFCFQAVRSFLIFELALAFLLCWCFRQFLQRRMWRIGGGLLLVFALLATEISHGFTCFCSSTLTSAIRQIKTSTDPDKKVLSTSTYGFLVRTLGDRKPFMDMHHLQDNGRGLMMLMLPVEQAVREFKKQGIGCVMLTTHDFSQTVQRGADGKVYPCFMVSGGLQPWITKLSDEELKDSFLFQTSSALFQQFPVAGVTKIAFAKDPRTQLSVVIYKIE